MKKNNFTTLISGKVEVHEKSLEMVQYEFETGRHAIWRGVITVSFKKWVKGEKIYLRNKERISLYISEKSKEGWINFIKSNENIPTISGLIRESVNHYIINKKSGNLPINNAPSLLRVSGSLKEHLTAIKGYLQLLFDNYREDLSEKIFSDIKNIHKGSMILEKEITLNLENIHYHINRT